jgi:hypothetical protein
MDTLKHRHTYLHVHTYTHTQTHVHTYTRIHTQTNTYVHSYTHTRNHTHTHTHTHTHIYAGDDVDNKELVAWCNASLTDLLQKGEVVMPGEKRRPEQRVSTAMRAASMRIFIATSSPRLFTRTYTYAPTWSYPHTLFTNTSAHL